MCVKLGNRLSFANRFARNRNAVSASGEDGFESNSYSTVRLPDALMLSCPALNLSLEISPSRVIGDQDPVLPSGLISAISDAYVPAEVGVSKRDPLVSPLYAPDDILRLFPPTLLYASSDDPLLDDSVYFNTRLRCLGVLSDLRATHHMPHAYWGLGTAGFPEAQQVQLECQEFLREQLDS
jgi:acetyl esterase/lipase